MVLGAMLDGGGQCEWIVDVDMGSDSVLGRLIHISYIELIAQRGRLDPQRQLARQLHHKFGVS